MRLLKRFQMNIGEKKYLLRDLSLNDAPSLFDIFSDKELTEPALVKRHLVLEESVALVNYFMNCNNSLMLVIESEECSETIGFVTLCNIDHYHSSAEIGSMIHERYHRQKVGSSALKTMLAIGFRELNLHRIIGRLFVENQRSEQLVKRVGMSYEGILRASFFFEDHFYDMKLYSMLKQDLLSV